MTPHWTLLVLIVSTHFLAIEGLKLVNNGYEDLYIIIQETVQESEELLERIQETFTDASELLLKATHRRTYFRSVKVIIPKTWTKKDSYITASSLSSSTSHIKIGNTDIKMPFTVGSETCGQEGMYIFLPSNEFILHRGRTLWGQHDSVIVHEWGHLRWGLKDEYPTIKKIVQPRFRKPFQTIGDRGAVIGNAQDMLSFYQSDAMWKPVGCTRDLKGYASSTCSTGESTGNCDQLNVAEMIGDNCLYCPDMAQTLNSSIMGYQYIPSVVEFCDIDSPATPEHMRHNSAATNEQNTYCNGKSAWEIMREHEDFKDGNNPPLTDDFPPSTQFQFVQEISNKVRVLVLDTSGSMATGDRITNLYKASKYIIESLLPEGSWLRIIDFDSSAIFLSDFVQINSATRPSLVSSLPKFGDGGTCIPCGLDLALSALNSFQQLDSIEESEVILISDGQNNAGDLEASTQKYVNAGVVVMCIAVTEAADQRLIDLAARTRGRIFAYSDLGSTSLAALFSEIISGGLSSDPVAAVTILNEPFSTTANIPINVTFNIDEGLGNATTVSVLTKTASNIQIRLTGPNRYEQTTSASQVEEASLVVPGVSEQGVYIVEVTSSTSLEMEVIVTSVPASVHVDIIRTVCRLSSGSSDVSSIETLPIMYVYVRKGESPVKKANVEVRIEGPSGKQTCILHPYDDGRDPDIRSDDGIYTAKLLQTCQEGNGRHNSKVVILGTEKTVVTNYKNSGSAFIDFEANEAEDKETGNFKRMAIAEAITVSNYDASITSQDRTPPGRITDVRVIDIQSSIPSAGLTRNYTITWTATGDDFNNGQASSYEMRISTNQTALRHDFINADRLNVTGVDMAPNISGKIERLQMTVSSNDAFTSTTYFAIVAIDDVGNRGKASNIIPITIGLNSHFEVVEEECTDDCYSVIPNCGRNLTIPNGQVNMTNALTTAGHSVPLICDTGYKLTGGTSIECLENGKWNGNVSCLIQDCGRSETIENGRVNFTNIQTTYGSSALVICDTGYNLIGGTSINCLADGAWNKSVTCEIVDCGRSETIENGRVNFTHIQTTYGSSAPVICDTGYNLTGGTSINCLADGVWNKTVMCEIVDCGRSETIENGKVNFTNIQTTYGSSAPVICDTGYNLRGEPDVTCLADGSWNKSVRCEIVDCGRPKPMANGRIDMTNKQTTYGSSAPVFCSVGFKLIGGHKIECLADGTWSQTLTCQIFDRSSESESHIKTEVMFAITASCVAMYFLCIIGLLAWTVIRKKRELDIRKLQYPKDSLPINANRLRSRTLAANANIAYEIEDVESLQEQELTEARTQL